MPAAADEEPAPEREAGRGGERGHDVAVLEKPSRG